MKSVMKFAVTGLTCLGMTISSALVMAAGPVAPASNNVSDIALAPGGTFFGHVVNAQGTALEGTVVKVYKGKSEVASSVTDQTGLFAVKNLRGGVYRVSAGQASGVYRFWTEDAAPPNASTKTVLVSSPQVVRGQLGALGALGGAGTVAAGGAAVGLGSLSVMNLNESQDLNDDLSDLQKRLQDTQKHLDEIESIVTF